MNRDNFNIEQLKAIDATINEDVLIAAGAGSGKTKTLSTKVNELMSQEHLKPSELLVLTFTNNAAHEMKERIIATFESGNPIKDQMLSSHIQTFDSFSSYLVTKYAGALNISDKVSLADASVIEAKTNQFLDEILEEYYEDDLKKQRLFKTLVKFNNIDERNTKKVILDLKNNLDKMLPLKRREFMTRYKELFMSRDFFDNCVEEYISYYKYAIQKTLLEAYVFYKNYDNIVDNPINGLQEAFDNIDNFNKNIYTLGFAEDNVYEIYKAVVNCLNKDGGEFIKACKELVQEKDNKFPPMRKPKDAADEAYKIIRELFGTKTSLFYSISQSETDLDEEYNKLLSFEDDITLMFEIINQLDDKSMTYKRITNTFTFSDISIMALSLVTMPEYKEIAKEIRNQFKYIMVDEYQDTNDFQEAFINSLLEPKDDGTSSHLFCVGDAKQAIYGFRNSKVELFRDRQHLYENGTINQGVIAMNKNYRSGPGLLKDINYIFSYYMTLSHGGIDFLEPSEQLVYDTKVNLYSKEYSDFHIKRLVSMSGHKDDGFKPKEWECDAIINDIRNKVSSGYLVYDRGCKEGLRPCSYKDFVILMRVKSGYQLYVERFSKAGIPLNNQIDTNLYDIDAILVIQSIIDLICFRKYGLDYNVKHLFASIARSYLYNYSDDKLYDLLSGDITILEQDQIMVDVDNFIKENEESSLTHLFKNLIAYFHIIDKLHLLTNIEDIVSKIESLYATIQAQEKAGDGLKEFSILLKDINKYKLELNANSVFSVQDAVDLMTIHASKGLERKIVYMPNSFNRISGGSNMDAPDYKFSEKYGIMLPYYNYDPSRKDDEGNVLPVSYKTIPELAYQVYGEMNNPEVDEHVRLFYVALTRAENTLYIVGDMTGKEESSKKKEDLYGMLSYCPHYIKINEDFVEKMLKNKAIKPETYNAYKTSIAVIKSAKLKFSSIDLEETNYRIYRSLYDDLFIYSVNQNVNASIDSIKEELFHYYSMKFIDKKDDLDFISRVYAYYLYKKDVSSFEDLSLLLNEDSKTFGFNVFNETLTKDNLKQELRTFHNKFVNADYDYFGVKFLAKSKQFSKTNKQVPIILLDAFFTSLLFAFDKLTSISEITYQVDDYMDIVEKFDASSFSLEEEKELELLPPTVKVDNSHIEFETRTTQRASKLSFQDEDRPSKDVLERGTYLHRLLELVNLKTKDTSFITNYKDKKIIDRVLSNNVFSNLDNASIYKEYGYYDEELCTTGFIDLLYIKDDEYYVVDYKSKHVEDDDYINQLKTYQRNIKRIFNVEEEKIHLFLLSIFDNKIYEIK